jgi:uncharacterized protein
MKALAILLLALAGPVLAQKPTRVIELKPVMYQMKFDPAEITAVAGEAVELVFTNADVLAHNVLICAPGSKAAIGRLADQLAVAPGKANPDYIPNSKDVLHALPPVLPGKKGVLRFVAPSEPGEYLFICTCPGQWQLMNGVFKVTPAK